MPAKIKSALSALLLLWLLIMIQSCQPERPLQIRVDAAPTTMNPLMPSSGYSRYVSSQLFQTLGLPDAETLDMKPWLAKAIPTAHKVESGAHQGELAYEFEIHEAATWDNENPVTAQDVAFTFKLIMNPGLPTDDYRGYYNYLSGLDIDAANPKKFTVYFKQYYFLALETLCQTPIYPAYQYDSKQLLTAIPLADFLDGAKAKAFADSEAGKTFTKEFTDDKYATDPQFISGSGAYRLKSMNGEQGTVLVKKQNWWGDNASLTNPYIGAYPEQIVYKVVKSESAAENMLRNNDLDLAVDLSPALFKELQQDTQLARLYDFKVRWAPRYSRLLLNLRSPDSILADQRVRQALAYMVDYDYLIKTIQQGFAQPVVGPINPAKPYYAKNLTAYTYNPAEAKRLLAQAGWKDSDGDGILDKMLNGQRTKLSLKMLTPNGSEVAQMLSDNVREKARQVGMELILDQQDISNITKKTKAGEFQLASMSAAMQPGLDELYQHFHSSSSDNRGRYRNVQLDSLIMAIRTTEDEAKRTALYLQAQQIIHEEVPIVFLYASQRRYVASKKYEYVLTANNAGYYEQFFQLKSAAPIK